MPVRYDSRKFQLSARRRVSLVASKCVRSIIIVSRFISSARMRVASREVFLLPVEFLPSDFVVSL